MKFGDKLIALRKKRGFSQEELAEKLNVSRQSVSKWESNNTYPETEKIVQICNLFNCSMDDLINDKIVDIEQVERKDKSAAAISIDSLLDFITKTIDMFAGMTFGSGLKCVIELLIIAGVMAFLGFIVISIATGLIGSLLSFIRYNYVVSSFISSILEIIWFIITLITVVHIFKIRYLNYYEDAVKNNDKDKDNKDNTVTDKNKTTSSVNGKNKSVFHEKKRNVVIRDSKDQPFAFLSSLSKIVIYFIKFCACMFNIGVIFTLFGLVVAFVVLIPFSFNSMLFFGINLALLAAIFITLLLTVLLFQFIFSKNINVKLAIILFISFIVLGGIGSGVGILGLKDIEVKTVSNSDNLVTYEEKINYTDNLYIDHYGYDVDYIIDNSIVDGEIIINTNYDERLFKVRSRYYNEDNMRGYSVHTSTNLNFKKFYDIFIKDLKDNKIVDYGSSEFDSITVIANQNTVDKLLNNLSKMYLYEKMPIDNGVKTTDYESKVEIDDDYDCSSQYDALNDTMKIDSRYCKCERREIETYKGMKVIYDCESNDYDDYDE